MVNNSIIERFDIVSLLFSLLLASPIFAEETRTKIAIIDSGINDDEYLHPFLCKDGHKDFTGTGFSDNVDHGTIVTSLIIAGLNSNEYCILIYKWNNNKEKSLIRPYLKALRQADLDNVSYVNISLGGDSFDDTEKTLITNLLNKGVIITVAAGNSAQNLDMRCDVFPACYFKKKKNFYVVANTNMFKMPQDNSNYNGPVNSYENGHEMCYRTICKNGTSFSAPIRLNRLLHEKTSSS